MNPDMLQHENDRLRQQNARLLLALEEIEGKLREPEQIIRAIRQGEVDTVVVQEKGQEQIYSLQAVEQLRALVGEITLAEQRQRRHLAKMLHDSLQQSLLGIQFQVSFLAEDNAPDPPTTIRKIKELLAECLNAARSLTAELSPPLLQEEGLVTALEWLARWMGERHGLNVALEADADLPALPEDMHVLLFESVRELVFNVVKHAGKRSASVVVRQEKRYQLHVTVSDDGHGFDSAALRQNSHPRDGMGLLSIRERIALLGGHMSVDSAPGQGCRVSLTVPLGPRATQAPL
jgi:signal transduction histidine kinase